MTAIPATIRFNDEPDETYEYLFGVGESFADENIFYHIHHEDALVDFMYQGSEGFVVVSVNGWHDYVVHVQGYVGDEKLPSLFREIVHAKDADMAKQRWLFENVYGETLERCGGVRTIDPQATHTNLYESVWYQAVHASRIEHPDDDNTIYNHFYSWG